MFGDKSGEDNTFFLPTSVGIQEVNIKLRNVAEQDTATKKESEAERGSGNSVSARRKCLFKINVYRMYMECANLRCQYLLFTA